MEVCALIVAGGRGSRAQVEQGEFVPKQYAKIGGEHVLTYAMRVFLTHPAVSHVQVVIHETDREAYEFAIPKDTASLSHKLLAPVFGGMDRQSSVLAGLEALERVSPDVVLIHDAARPFVDFQVVDAVLAGVERSQGAICAVPVSDTLKMRDDDGLIAQTVSREGLWRAQTPQGFPFGPILDAHRRALVEETQEFTDDASVAQWAGLAVSIVDGAAQNVKLTTAQDIERADKLMRLQQTGVSVGEFEVRVGSGYDVHKFGEGDRVWVCGVRIPHDKMLVGHSDADVGLHAITDALLGSIGAGDIGMHFPPSDAKWKGARSDVFLKHAMALVRERAGVVVNVDVTLICETPKMGPHRDAMRGAIGGILGLDVDRVSVKATTTEQLGFTGRGEGMAAMATVSVRLPA